MINAQTLALVKPGVMLINVSRGGCKFDFDFVLFIPLKLFPTL